ncbi:MAG TPA: iron ABC transporter permease [Candidatus Omnitrophica bacterium]|nr:iron ABC transporter permease [Candidatus Omnitrophota bacterium]
MKQNNRIKFFLLSGILLFSIILGITKGSVDLSLRELLLEQNRHILLLRLLRVALAIIAGSGLAACGITLQAILRNPLAEPYLLGTSSGAGLGAVAAIIFGALNIYLPLAAFAGASLTVVLVYLLARQDNKIEIQSLILAGVVVSVALSGIIVFLVSFYDNKALHGILWWLWGSLQVYDIKLLGTISILVIGGIIFIYTLSQDLNALSLGEEEAIHLGVDAETIKKYLFLVTSLITAGIVCICGIIGFVGLIIPHATRYLVGPNHRVLIPAACVAASAFMILCDLISRTLTPPFEIPIGVITACIGAPLFIALLKAKEKIK